MRGLLGGFVWLYAKDKTELAESSIWWNEGSGRNAGHNILSNEQ